jgi:N-formylglutamate amidohydrolase
MRPILHIPHAGREVPARYHESYIGGLDTISAETEILGDLWTDQLFASERVESLSVVFPYSRVFVDVERFRDDDAEPMAKRGMGALYLNGHDLRPIRSAPSDEERNEILSRYYDPHHDQLTRLVDEAINEHGRALIIDCHSFPKERLAYEDLSSHDRPEICIGTGFFSYAKRSA